MNITKQQIAEKSPKLASKWTVTLEHGDPEWDPEYEKEISKVLQEEIDWEVQQDMMVKMGWTQIEMSWPHRMSAVDAHAVKQWCRDNLQGHYKGRARIWLFEKEQDATMFVLRWR